MHVIICIFVLFFIIFYVYYYHHYQVAEQTVVQKERDARYYMYMYIYILSLVIIIIIIRWLSKQQSKKNLFGSQSWQRRWYSLIRYAII